MSHGMSDDTFVKTANKHFSGKGEVGKDGYSTQNKFTAELMRRQQSTGKDFEGKPLYKKVDKIQTNSYDPLSNKKILGISEKILKKNFNLGEEGYDIARDEGRVKPSKDKKDATTMPPSKEMEKTRKKYKGPSALEIVKKKYKGQIMDLGKK